jgi:hypothetical protein
MVFKNLTSICSEKEECIQRLQEEIIILKPNQNIENTPVETTKHNEELLINFENNNEKKINTFKLEISVLRAEFRQLQTKLVKLESDNSILGNFHIII